MSTEKREKRMITNESGKSIIIMIDPVNITQNFYSDEWVITAFQWRRLVRESDNTFWRNERGAPIEWTCLPYVAWCKFPGLK